MSLNNARIALYTYIDNNYTAAAIAFRGDDQRAEALDNSIDPWIFIDISWGDEIKKTMGSPSARFIQLGAVVAKLYVRKEDGDGILDQKTDAFMTAMRTKQIGNITTTETALGPKQATEKWLVRHIDVSFQVSNNFSILPV